MIRVVTADDQAVVRSGLRTILESREDIDVVGEAGNGLEACSLVRNLEPDVILMDIRMPMMDGLEATKWLVKSGSRTRVLILTTFDLDEYVYEALKAGASGFLVKTDSPARIIDAVGVVAAGGSLLSPDVTHRLIGRFVAGVRPDASQAAVRQLTQREVEVLSEVAQGLSNAEIASKLFIGEGTVKTHVARVFAKLGLRDRVQAVIFAYESGLIQPGRGN